MLSRKECENALTKILCNIGVARSDYRTSGKAKEDYHTLKSLIEEHFDNPPLEWEEIKVNDVIFDKELKETIKIKDKFIFDDIKNINFEIFGSNRTYAGTYEENRFYRYCQINIG